MPIPLHERYSAYVDGPVSVDGVTGLGHPNTDY
jgi:hypothetical protein